MIVKNRHGRIVDTVPAHGADTQTEVPVFRRFQFFVKSPRLLKCLPLNNNRGRAEIRFMLYRVLVWPKKGKVRAFLPETGRCTHKSAAHRRATRRLLQRSNQHAQPVVGGTAVLSYKTKIPPRCCSYPDIAHLAGRKQLPRNHDTDLRSSDSRCCRFIRNHHDQLILPGRKVLPKKRFKRCLGLFWTSTWNNDTDELTCVHLTIPRPPVIPAIRPKIYAI